MKSREFHEFLLDAQKFKGDDAGRHLGQLAQIFEALPEKTVAFVINKLAHVRPPTASFLSTKLQVLREPLALLHRLMSRRAKAPLLKDIQLLQQLVENHASVAIDVFVSTAMEALTATTTRPKKGKDAIRTDLVERYNHRLEAALGDDSQFRPIFDELVGDAEIGSAEAAALAKQFAHAAARSKPAAFKKIYARHQALMTSRARSLATAGRVAG